MKFEDWMAEPEGIALLKRLDMSDRRYLDGARWWRWFLG